jgi:hypothetical protein
MTQPAPLALPLIVDGRLDADCTCRGCGYNLRGLEAQGRCTECGLWVQESLLSDELRNASLAWLTRVLLGFRLMYWSQVAMLVLATIIFFSLMTDMATVALVVGSVGMIVCVLIAPVGLFVATAPDPAALARGRARDWRRASRVLLLATLAVAIGTPVIGAAAQNPVVDLVMIWAEPAINLLYVASALAFAYFILALLDRTAEEKVRKSAKSFRTLITVAVLFVGASVILESIGRIANRSASQPAMSALADTGKALGGCGSCLLTIAWLTGVVLLGKVTTVLKTAVQDAQARVATPPLARPVALPAANSPPPPPPPPPPDDYFRPSAS